MRTLSEARPIKALCALSVQYVLPVLAPSDRERLIATRVSLQLATLLSSPRSLTVKYAAGCSSPPGRPYILAVIRSRSPRVFYRSVP